MSEFCRGDILTHVLRSSEDDCSFVSDDVLAILHL